MLLVYRCLVAVLLLTPVGLVQAQQDTQMLELLQQLTRLEDEVRQLRGDVERLSHSNKRLRNQQNDLYLDLDKRLRAQEAGLAAGQPGVTILSPSPTTLPTATSNTAEVAVSGTALSSTPAAQVYDPVQPAAAAGVDVSAPVSVAPAGNVVINPAQEQAAYKAAFNLLRAGKYDEAILAYSEFLRKFPASKYAANAQYWLGEASYVTRRFPVAIDEFNKVISQYPQSKKLPDAMLKIGYIHYELKALSEARQILTELTRQYPGTTAARLAENRLQRMKLEGR